MPKDIKMKEFVANERQTSDFIEEAHYHLSDMPGMTCNLRYQRTTGLISCRVQRGTDTGYYFVNPNYVMPCGYSINTLPPMPELTWQDILAVLSYSEQNQPTPDYVRTR